MSNRATPSRSFNTVKHSNRDKRIKRRRQERVVLLSICLVVIALLLSAFVFLICSIVDVIKTNNPGGNQQSGDLPADTTPSNSAQDLTYMSVTQSIHTGELLIVNSAHAYEFPAQETGLTAIYHNRLKFENVSNTYMVNGNNTSWTLKKAALDALNQMMYKYYESFGDGSTSVSSAYRSYADQASLGSSVQPGYSDHHTGYCVALMTDAGKSYLEDSHWIYSNAYKYGFIQRYPDEKSSITGVSGYEHCFRYVGIPHATYMKDNNLCFEEYVEAVKSYSIDNQLKITDNDGKNYSVYYVAADYGADIVTLKVPKNYNYTVSGNNIDGCIVTVYLDEPLSV